jgi:ATP-binding protein involved in chromosome partitioning
VVVVASGKGGVGKSTVSLNLAVALAEHGVAVGLLDADVYGPDIPRMVNLTRTNPLSAWTLWKRPGRALEIPPVERFGVRIMSAGFLLAEDQPLAWSADLVRLVLRQLLANVAWGPLDYLVVDLPPGTADVTQQIITLTRPSGAVLVVTPQDVAHLDAKKVLAMLRAAEVPILGGVENMGPLACPHCGGTVDVLPAVSPDRAVWASGVRCLGRVPLDPSVAEAGESGRPLLLARPEGPQAQALRNVAAGVMDALAVAGEASPRPRQMP